MTLKELRSHNVVTGNGDRSSNVGDVTSSLAASPLNQNNQGDLAISKNPNYDRTDDERVPIAVAVAYPQSK